LVEVNGVNVQNMTREEVVEIIQKSGDTLHICVQPIPELIELSVRPASDGGKIEIQDDVVKGGTLKRNASLRYKKGVSNIVLLLIFIKLYLYYSSQVCFRF
jgi:myosin-18